MPKVSLSIVLATYNEEANLARCLDAVKAIASEIVIADGQSSDKTVEIAAAYKAKVITTTNKPNFHINKNIAIDAASGDWILQLDADEVVSSQLAQEIQTVLTATPNGYWIPRLNYFLGQPLTKGGQYPDYTLRLYRNGSGRLPAKDVHEQAVVTGEVGYLTSNLLHFNTPDFENYLLRFNRYTSLLAGQLKDTHVPISFWSSLNYLFLKPAVEFASIYLRHKGFVDGFPGFVFALFSGLRFGVAYIKYWQETCYPK
jgi:glycosyltransferase involved in cell wall biosynthesis